MTIALLADRAVLAVSGEDARPFLQGLISNDIEKVGAGHAVFAALLSPQGRFLYDFFITEHEGKLLLETEKARMADLIKRLSMYRLRSKVEFAELPQMKVGAAWGQGAEVTGQIHYADPRLPELGVRALYDKETPTGAGTADEYDRHRLSLGVPGGSKDLIVDRSILLEYGYDELHGVDFGKGCYVGQEVTARSKHRATLRKFIHRVTAPRALPARGAPVTAAGREVGIMASSNGAMGLALLNVAEVEHARREGVLLESSGVVVNADLPVWCATAFNTEPK